MAAWFVYSPAARGGWIWDDPVEVPQNAVLRDPSGLAKIWSGAVGVDYFPLKTTVQWVAWHLWGDDTAGYHGLNIGLHLLSAFLLWRLLAKLGLGAFGAWLGGLLFVVHPLAVESVAWISELKNTLSLPFLLMAMIAWIDYDREVAQASRLPSSKMQAGTPALLWYLLSVLCFFAAMLSKTSVVMLPAVILAYCWWKRGRIARRDYIASLPFFAVAIALGLVTVWYQHHRAIAGAPLNLPGIVSRFAAAGLAMAFYLGKCVFPVGLEPIYPRWDVSPPSPIQFLPWVVIVAMIVWLATRATKPALLPIVVFGLGFFALNLVPVMGLVPMAYLRITWVSDHFAYISLLGVIGLAAAGFGAWHSSSGTSGKIAAVACAALLIAVLAVKARAYDAVFRDEKTLWTYALEHNPDSGTAQGNLGKALFLEGNLPEAEVHFRRAAALNPDDAESHFNLGLVLANTGRQNGAIYEYQTALRLKPSFAEAQDCLGNALLNLGRPAEASDCYQAALRLDPDYPEAHANLGVALAELGRTEEAEQQMEKALQLRPDYPVAEQNLRRLRAQRAP